MTLDEILQTLEALKDFVNDHQKPTLERLKEAVSALGVKEELPVVQEAEVIESSASHVITDMREESKDEFKPTNHLKKKRKPYKRRSPK